MRKVSRDDFPKASEMAKEALESLVRKKGHPDKKTEYEWALQHMRDRRAGLKTTSYKYDRYSLKAVKSALEQMFHGKCAYCEGFYARSQPVDVEHFRPKNAVEGVSHGGYWWLAMAWENLLPSCIDCNRVQGHAVEIDADAPPVDLKTLIGSKYKSANTGKGNFFPLSQDQEHAQFDWETEQKPDLSVETPLLIDPCDPADDPMNHLIFSTSEISLVGARKQSDGLASAKGLVSIALYGLNRVDLVQARTKVLRDLELLFDVLEKVETIIENVQGKVFIQAGADFASLTEEELNNAKLEAEMVLNYLQVTASNIAEKFVELADPKSEYCTLVRAWLDEKGMLPIS